MYYICATYVATSHYVAYMFEISASYNTYTTLTVCFCGDGLQVGMSLLLPIITGFEKTHLRRTITNIYKY